MTDLKSMFTRARTCAYLDTAAEGLPMRGCREALIGYFEDKSRGTPARRRLHELERAALGAAARLLGTDPANVALLASASDGLNLFANSIDWRPGDEVVVTDLEFPSGVLTWLRLRNRGVRIRVIPSHHGTVSLADFASIIGPATRVVCASHVSYKTGTRIPFLRELFDLAHQHGALLVVDATQSLGRLPVVAESADFLVASGYKWLLGIHGLAVAYLSPVAGIRIFEGSIGWYSVSSLFSPDRFNRYESKPGAGWMMCGMPNFPAMYVLRDSIEFLLDQDVASLDLALSPLVSRLRTGIARLGFELLTPSEAQYTSGIVSFLHPCFEQIGAELGRQGIMVWTGDGRIRASVHLYNDEHDIDCFLQALESISEELVWTTHS